MWYLPEMKGNEMFGFLSHSVNKQLAHPVDRLCISHGMVVHSAPQLLELCIQLVRQPVIEFGELYNLQIQKMSIHSHRFLIKTCVLRKTDMFLIKNGQNTLQVARGCALPWDTHGLQACES